MGIELAVDWIRIFHEFFLYILKIYSLKIYLFIIERID